MSQRASLSQCPVSSVGNPSSLVTVPMETSSPDMSPSSTRSHLSAHHTGDSPQPSYTLQRTHPIYPQYGESVCLNVMYYIECWYELIYCLLVGFNGSSICIIFKLTST